MKDIVARIQDFSFKQKSPEKVEGLLPTLPNLYGLDVRFRYTERKIREEKERRRAIAPSGSSKKHTLLVDNTKHEDDEPPKNRHGNYDLRTDTKKYFISPTSYKKKSPRPDITVTDAETTSILAP
mmetsp:Transcript_1584/g.2110  ORF Transcript_1584/g.2110 Transcript_1584/m.2110 type:complete len:125 (-) Transcript_1584:141-515(-)